MQKMREQIVDEYKRTPLDQARLAPLIDRLTDLRADQQKETVRALAQLEAQLDARSTRSACIRSWSTACPVQPPCSVSRAQPPPRPSQ